MFSAGAFSSAPIATSAGFIYDNAVGEGATAVASKFLVNNVFNPVVGEGASGAEQLALINNVFNPTVPEGAYVGTPREVGGGFSSGAFASGAFSALGDETRLVSGDLFIANIDAGAVFQDSARPTDRVVGAANFAVQAFDSAESLDETGVYLTVNRTIAETASAADEISATPTYAVTIQEVSALSDSVTGVPTFACTVADQMVLSDAFSNRITFKGMVQNRVTVQDRTRTQLQVNILMAERVVQVDIINGQAQWEPINTYEVTDWILVNTSKPN